MSIDDQHPSFKVILIGNTGVGKTSLVYARNGGAFDEDTASTIQPAFSTTEVEARGQIVTLQLWDTAGQEKYQDLMSQYYHGAVAAILCFEKDTFQSVNTWIDRIRAQADKDCQIVLTITKEDMLTQEESHELLDRAYAYMDHEAAAVCVTSAKSGTGVNELFQMAADLCVLKCVNEPTTEVSITERRKKKGGCCG